MKDLHFEDLLFEQEQYKDGKLTGGEYTACVFVQCDFSGCNFADSDFIDCSFRDCNLSLVQLNDAGLKGCTFTGCKMTGVDYSVCSSFLFAVNFDRCILDYSSFFQRKMRKTMFSGCSVKEVDFEEADLAGSAFKDCDLFNATCVHTILEKVDFRSAVNFNLDPELNKIKKARFSYAGLGGLLGKYGIDIA